MWVFCSASRQSHCNQCGKFDIIWEIPRHLDVCCEDCFLIVSMMPCISHRLAQGKHGSSGKRGRASFWLRFAVWGGVYWLFETRLFLIVCNALTVWGRCFISYHSSWLIAFMIEQGILITQLDMWVVGADGVSACFTVRCFIRLLHVSLSLSLWQKR